MFYQTAQNCIDLEFETIFHIVCMGIIEHLESILEQ